MAGISQAAALRYSSQLNRAASPLASIVVLTSCQTAVATKELLQGDDTCLDSPHLLVLAQPLCSPLLLLAVVLRRPRSSVHGLGCVPHVREVWRRRGCEPACEVDSSQMVTKRGRLRCSFHAPCCPQEACSLHMSAAMRTALLAQALMQEKWLRASPASVLQGGPGLPGVLRLVAALLVLRQRCRLLAAGDGQRVQCIRQAVAV